MWAVAQLPMAATPLAGKVVRPDGKPAIAADVVAQCKGDRIRFSEGQLFRQNKYTIEPAKTDDQGRFRMELGDSYRLTIIHESGCREIWMEDLPGIQAIRLQPWGGITGRIELGEEGGAGETLTISRYGMTSPWDPVSVNQSVRADASGHFKFDRVFPGLMKVGWLVPSETRTKTTVVPSSIPSHTRGVEVKPGETARVDLLKTGYRLKGRMKPPIDYSKPVNYLGQGFRLVCTDPGRPPGIPDSLSPKKAFQRVFDRNRSETGMKQSTYVMRVKNDGTFFVDYVKPGKHVLDIEVSSASSKTHDPPVGGVHHSFTLPPLKDATLNPVFNVGELEVKIHPNE